MFLKIKKIPKVKWSSDKAYNFKPKFSTFFFLCFGLTLFGLGEGLLIVSFMGASPWSVLAQGISLNVNLSIGTITLLISLGVLVLWIPLGQKLGMGTIFNALIIAIMIALSIVPIPSFWPSGIHKTNTPKLIKRVIVPILRLTFKEIPCAKTLHGEAPVKDTINKPSPRPNSIRPKHKKRM